MKIQTSFELRAVGDKIVLRQCVAPAYDMKTVLVADGYECIPGHEAFILLKGNKKHIFCEAGNELHQVTADEYVTHWGKILFKTDGQWYLWADVKDETNVILLGEQIPQLSFYFFYRAEDCIYLNWLSSKAEVEVNTRKFRSFDVLRQDVLDEGISVNNDICSDVFKGETEAGVLYGSIKKETHFGFSGGQRCTATSYTLIFSDKSSAKLIELNSWVRNFLKEKTKKGFGVPANVCVTEEHLSGKQELKVKLFVYHQPFRHVEILVNLSMILSGVKKAYFVTSSAPGVEYNGVGEDVMLVDNNDGVSLFVVKKKRADRFLAGKNAFSSTLELKRNVKLP